MEMKVGGKESVSVGGARWISVSFRNTRHGAVEAFRRPSTDESVWWKKGAALFAERIHL